MLVEERRQLILKWIMDEDSVSLEELEKRLNVTLMTIRRDLGCLQQQGYIKRVRGGAVKVVKDFFYQMRGNTRKNIYLEEKIRIARYAVQHFVNENDIIVLEGGTTVSSMGPYLNIDNLTIMTNGLNIISILSKFMDKIELISCGGVLYEKEMILTGNIAEDFFKKFRAHKCFFGAIALNIEDGALECNLPVIGVKKAMVDCAKERILLIDSSKFGVSSLMPAVPLEKIDIVVTDEKAPQDIVDSLRSFDIEVHIAD